MQSPVGCDMYCGFNPHARGMKSKIPNMANKALHSLARLPLQPHLGPLCFLTHSSSVLETFSAVSPSPKPGMSCSCLQGAPCSNSHTKALNLEMCALSSRYKTLPSILRQLLLSLKSTHKCQLKRHCLTPSLNWVPSLHVSIVTCAFPSQLFLGL